MKVDLNAPTLPVALAWEDDADDSLGLPEYVTSGAAGADLRANFPADTRDSGLVLKPGERALVPTGLRMSVPEGFEVQIRPRSGLALKHGVTLVNSPGTIDSDYRGPIGIIMINHGTEDFAISHGDRIAQMVLAAVTRAHFVTRAALSDTARGKGGFGSTGAK